MVTFVMLSFLVQSCSRYDEIMKNAIESTASGWSHNAGNNCMACHHDAKNEASEKWWYVAGTTFDQNSSPASAAGVIELWTQPNRTGELIHSLTIDAAGNFYSQKIIDFKGGFYPVAVSNGGKVSAMTSKITEGACNSCHGVTEAVIKID